MHSTKYSEVSFADIMWSQIIEPMEPTPTESNPICDDNFDVIAKRMGIVLDSDDNLITSNVQVLSEGEISLAFEQLSRIPREVADTFAMKTHSLDLSYNSLVDLSFLKNFYKLHSLILDRNTKLDESTLPSLPSLKLLWLNHCEISNLSKWIQKLQICCPQIHYLSLMGNSGALSQFNGGSPSEQNDYRVFVISSLPTIQHLDDTAVTPAERNQAKSFKYLCGLSNAMTSAERFGHRPEHRHREEYAKRRLQVSKRAARSKIEIIHSHND